MAFSVLIEVSQLYHAPWLDSIRHTTLGGLILGYGFLWGDLACYAVGIGLGVVIEAIGIVRPRTNPTFPLGEARTGLDGIPFADNCIRRDRKHLGVMGHASED